MRVVHGTCELESLRFCVVMNVIFVTIISFPLSPLTVTLLV